MVRMLKGSPSILACAVALALCPEAPAEPAVVGLARAYLGPQSTIDAIQSIHYVGTLERTDPGQKPAEAVRAGLDIVLAKPLRQHLVIRGPRATFTTVLDGYDAWDQQQDNQDASRVRTSWLSAGDIRTLRANTWENLYYYRLPDGGRVEDLGTATVDGIVCEHVTFTHDPGITYERYFDRDTGRLVLTVKGSQSFREVGEILVDGIRFPKSIVTVTKAPSGGEVTATATFDTITLNEPVNPSLFATPNTAPRAAAAPSATKGP